MKKTLSLLLFFFVLLLGGCQEDRLKVVADELAVLIPKQITESLELPDESGGVMIFWSSSNHAVLSPEGKLVRQEEDTEVELYAVLIHRDKKINLKFVLTVPGVGSTDEEKPDDSDDEKSGPGEEKPGEDRPDEKPELPDYYDGWENLIGSSLKAFLHEFIDDHKKQSYDSAKKHLLITDEDPENPGNFILFYTGVSVSKNSAIGGLWDREHIWPKSHGGFSNNSIPGSDLHNLKPSDKTANNRRGNLDFDEGGRPLTEVIYAPNSTQNKISSSSFEPRDENKGDVARIVFYMTVRYEGGSGEPDLELNDSVNNGSRPYLGRVSVLLRWNREDPVDDFEKRRNEEIFKIQGNRNPFIDFPEFAEMIWGDYLN